MTFSDFFLHLTNEIKQNKELENYYRFTRNKWLFHFRYHYIYQRYMYILNNISTTDNIIWDCGCGYGTLGYFLSLNNKSYYGNTIEYYTDLIEKRNTYWSKFGNLNNLKIAHADLFDKHTNIPQSDVIVLMDTLHHLEPIDKAFDIFSEKLKKNGKLIICEENGTNPFIRIKNFIKRGNNRIIEIYDKNLQKNILVGNENTRSLNQWKQFLEKHNYKIHTNSIQFFRFFPPVFMNSVSASFLLKLEYFINKKLPFFRNYFFFGVSFIATPENE